MKNVNKQDLSLVGTNELIDELTGRFPNALFIGMKVDGHNKSNYWWNINGNEIECLGLYVKMNDIILEHFRQNREGTD